MSQCMKEMGKLFLNDDVWATYDVIIGTDSATGGDYPLPVRRVVCFYVWLCCCCHGYEWKVSYC
jgi:hypothetical protein